MSKIILAPYAAKLRSGNHNPKNYPWWAEVVAMLDGHEVIQIGVKGEDRIEGVAQFIVGWPLGKLREVISEADTWVACDSFLPHFCYCERLKGGVVVWGTSDPAHWGHNMNTNLLKDRHNLRRYQFQHWEDEPYREDVFVSPQEVVDAIQARLTRTESADRPAPFSRSLQLAAT